MFCPSDMCVKLLTWSTNNSKSYFSIFRFNLYLKLLFAMGVNWSLETISWALETFATVPKEIFYVTDFCNAIYGLLIFLIFVCKKRTWKILKKRYGSRSYYSAFTICSTVSRTSLNLFLITTFRFLWIKQKKQVQAVQTVITGSSWLDSLQAAIWQ